MLAEIFIRSITVQLKLRQSDHTSQFLGILPVSWPKKPGRLQAIGKRKRCKRARCKGDGKAPVVVFWLKAIA